MKLIITTKDEIPNVLYYLADEIISKYEALNPGIVTENIDYEELEELKGNNPFVYIAKLDINGNIDLDKLKDYQRVIYLADGIKYQELLKKIFTEEKTDELKATYLFDLKDAFIVTDEIGSKKIPKEE